MTTIGIIIIVTAVLTAAAVVVWDRWRTRRLLKRLDTMLEKAITQGFCNRFWYSSVPILPAAPFHEHIVRYVLATQSALLCYPGLFHPRTAKSDMFLTIA